MFEWDESKRQANLEKHGLDFSGAALLFDGRPVIDLPARSEGELRTISVALVNDTFVTLVWTLRGSNRRIISFRRSRHEERRAYRELFP